MPELAEKILRQGGLPRDMTALRTDINRLLGMVHFGMKEAVEVPPKLSALNSYKADQCAIGYCRPNFSHRVMICLIITSGTPHSLGRHRASQVRVMSPGDPGPNQRSILGFPRCQIAAANLLCYRACNKSHGGK